MNLLKVVQRKLELLPARIIATPGNLFENLCRSLKTRKAKIIIFIDDISDYLDESEDQNLSRDIGIIQDFLLRMQSFNQDFVDSETDIRFVSLVRDDLFDFMEGSNTGKIKSDSLLLSWKEKDFASLLIKRMSVFDDCLEETLKDPIGSIKKWFPDEIFSSFLESFGTNRYKCNFYAYIVAISFNRPRDYLKFCYAMRDRLSKKHPATSENIESAEVEYTDYLQLELRDELYLVSRVFDYDFTEDRINLLINKMIEKDVFGYAELKSSLGKFLPGKKVGHKKIEILLVELWRYGVIGIKEKEDEIIRFKYLSDPIVFVKDNLKKYKFYLHRGLWWFTKKRKKLSKS